MILYSNTNKTHFHFKGFVLSFVFKVRVSGTRKWVFWGLKLGMLSHQR